MRFIHYDNTNSEAELTKRSGQSVSVIRELSNAEVDDKDVGKMFKIRFADGFEADCFEDELKN